MVSRSDVWKYCSKSSDSSVKCGLCDKELTYSGTTSNLRDHLLRRHAVKYKPQQQKTLVSLRQKCPKSKAKAVMNLLVDVVTMDLRPIAIVEGVGMTRLLKYLEPGFTMPSRKHIAKLVQAKYEKAVSLLKTLLSNEAVSMALRVIFGLALQWRLIYLLQAISFLIIGKW